MCIYLIRHGQTIANLKDEAQGQLPGELSKLGWKQARQLGESLQDVPLNSIITSDLHRAVQTASCIAQYHNMTPREEPLLREQNWGIYQGRPTQEALANWNPGEPEAFIDPPQGESISDLVVRARRFWALYAPHFVDKNSLIVSHGTFLSILMLVIFDYPIPDNPPEPLGNASVTILQNVSSSGYKVYKFNDTSHL